MIKGLTHSIVRKLTNRFSGLSADEQRAIFDLLRVALQQKDRLEQKMEDLIAQNNRLEIHVLEIKASIKTQNEAPPQILLQRPVVLYDALGRIAPFHLEFISSLRHY